MTISVSQSDGARWVQDKSPRSILTLKPKHRESWYQEVRALASSCVRCAPVHEASSVSNVL